LLSGVKVLSFTHFLQGPSAVQFLADLGADVIKIERPEGAYERHWAGVEAFINGESVFYMLAGRNQRSLSINLRNTKSKEIIWKLIKEADVIVENFRPGVMDRLGFGYEDVKKVNPKIVYCSCSGFGTTGPYRDKPGQDLLIQAMSGLAQLSGRKNDPPMLVGTAIVDQHAAVLAALGVLAALFERTRTGKGKRVESNLLNAALDLQIEPFNYYLNGKELYERSESGISSRFHEAPYGVFETANGYLCLSLTSTENLAKAFDDSHFLTWTKEDQFKKREEINKRVAHHIKQKPTEYWFKVFDQLGIWYSPVNTYKEVVENEQVKWNKSILSFEHPKAGEVRLLAHPIRYDGNVPPLKRIPPELGEHTNEILKELGFTDEEIQELEEIGAVTTNKTAKNT